jgi:iron-sulfur cluster repair protein YtfE (RIC family)
VTQEAIDVLAIGIALLALAAPRRPGRRLTPAETDDLVRIQREHDALTATVDRIADVADRLDGAPEDLGAVRDLVAELETTLLPHERADEQRLAPLLVKRLGSPEAVTALHTAHAEIDQEVARLRRLVDDVDASGAEPSDRRELRRLLYEIHAVLRLHNSQETESVCSAMRAAGRALPLAVSGPGGGAGPATPR